MMAGRDISVDNITFGATRIMNVCNGCRPGAGDAAAMAVAGSYKPAEVDTKKLREKLLAQKAILDIK